MHRIIVFYGNLTYFEHILFVPFTMFKPKLKTLKPRPPTDPVYTAQKPEVLPINASSPSLQGKLKEYTPKFNLSLTDLSSQLDSLLLKHTLTWTSQRLLYNIYPELANALNRLPSDPRRLPLGKENAIYSCTHSYTNNLSSNI